MEKILLLSIVAFIALIIIIKYLTSKKRREIKKLRNYEKILNSYNANCALYCDYLQGLDDLEHKTPCVLYAGNNILTICTLVKPRQTIKLNYAQIKAFQYFNRDKIIPQMYELYLVNLASYSRFIIVKYLSDENETKEIFFSLDINNKRKIKNEYCLYHCNIFDHINESIPKRIEQIKFF